MNKQGSKSYLLRDSQSLSDFRHNERDIINQKLSSRQPFNSITNLHQLSVPKRLPSVTRQQIPLMQTPIKPSISSQKPTSSSKSDSDDHHHVGGTNHRFYSIQTLSQTPILKSTSTLGRKKTQTQMTFSDLKNPNQKGQLYLFQTPKDEDLNNKKRKISNKEIEIQFDQNYSKYQTRKSKAASGSNSSKKSKSSKKGKKTEQIKVQQDEERKITTSMIRTPQELEGIQCTPEQSANKQYIMNLKIALKETIDQNECLLQEVALLRDQVQSLTHEKKQRDDAIVQLTQALVNLQIKYGEQEQQQQQQQQDQQASPRIQEMLSRNRADYSQSNNSEFSYQDAEEDDQIKSSKSNCNQKSRRKKGKGSEYDKYDLEYHDDVNKEYQKVDSGEEEDEQDYISI